MPQREARAWWADVQYLREPAEHGDPPARALTLVGDSALVSDGGLEPAATRSPVDADPAAGALPLTGEAGTAFLSVPDAPRRRLRPVTDLESVDQRRMRAAQPRRTVEIRGRLDAPAGASDPAPARSRRPDRGGFPGVGPRPDRIAMWAVALGLFLLLVAALSSDSASAATRLGERPLKVGMVGRDVRHLQLRLKRVGFLDAPATARFGALTRRAVKRYQRSRCLDADGVAGAATVRALRRGAGPCRRTGRGGSRKGGSGGGSGTNGSNRDAYLEVQLGTRTLARGMAGRDVRTVQRLLDVRTTGRYGPLTADAVKAFQQRAGIGADGTVGPATRDALIQRQMRPRTATYYGPGLYGNRTACGQKLTRRLRGVAHRRLPCGAAVTLFHEGRFVTTRVVDRGPFVKGVTFDLTAATARELGSLATVRLRAAY